jgi:glycosyltransferase involved in cell wall biosynthesis
MGKTRICCFLEQWESGGIESFLNAVLKNIDLESIEVDIVVSKLGESIFTDGLKARGVNFIKLSGHTRSPKNYRMFKALLREKKYHAVHFNLFHSFALYYVKLARQAGVPVRIAHAHNTDLRKSPTKWIKLIINRVSRKLWKNEMTHTLACSDAAAQFIFGRSADEIIKNGIHPEKFIYSPEDRAKVRNQLGIGDCPLFGNVGRLCWQKNQEFLLTVHKKVLEKLPDARLLLVGEGDILPRLREKASELGIENSVIFYGVSTEIPALMSAMDVFLFPSNMEGLGIVAIEAQASGLPTLCSDRVPHEAFITDLASSMALELGEEKWAKRAVEIYENAEKRRSRYDKICAQGYDIKSTAEQMKKYFLLQK